MCNGMKGHRKVRREIVRRKKVVGEETKMKLKEREVLGGIRRGSMLWNERAQRGKKKGKNATEKKVVDEEMKTK